jgi:hypothetical protein
LHENKGLRQKDDSAYRLLVMVFFLVTAILMINSLFSLQAIRSHEAIFCKKPELSSQNNEKNSYLPCDITLETGLNIPQSTTSLLQCEVMTLIAVYQ